MVGRLQILELHHKFQIIPFQVPARHLGGVEREWKRMGRRDGRERKLELRSGSERTLECIEWEVEGQKEC